MSVFSVVMPVYNVEKYLHESIESVLNQTFKDFELIIVNDGSSDESLNIAKQFKEKDSRILILNQKNAGLSAARNAGIKRAKGQYIYFLDSDDYLKNDFLEKMFNIFTTKKVDTIFFLPETFIDGDRDDSSIIEHYDRYYERSLLEEKDYSAIEYYTLMAKNSQFVASACLQISKLSLFKKNKLYFEKGIINEDELFTRVLLFAGDKVYFCKERFYYRRIRELSITTSSIKSIKPYSHLKIAEKLFTMSKKNNNHNLMHDSLMFFDNAIFLLEKHFRNNTKLKREFLISKMFFKVSKQRKRIFILNFPQLYTLYSKIFN